MKNLIRILVIIALVLVGYIIIDSVITKSDKTAGMPELASASSEYGSLTEADLSEKQYSVHKQTLNSIEAIDKTVNGQIEAEIKTLTDEAVTGKVPGEDEKALYINAIDTYKVNDKVVSVRVTSMSRKAFESSFKKNITVYNYDISTGQPVTMEELFGEDAKATITDYSDKYLLNHNMVEFYTGDQTVTCKYNSIKNYLKSNLLTKDNLEVSQSEYDAILSGTMSAEDKTPAKKPDDPTETATDKTTADASSTEEGSSSTETVSANTEKPGDTTTEKSSEKTTVAPAAGGKMVAFTFDDGPSKTNTDKILDILKQYGVHATFFMQGKNASYYPEVVKRIYDEGNELGNHTWDHQNLKNLTEAEINEEIDSAADAIEAAAGARPMVVRPPYGGYNDTVKAVVKEPLIRWSVDSEDWASRDENVIVPKVLEEVEDGDIILFHDIHETTTPAIARLVPALIEKGYQIVSVSELIAAKGYDINSQDLWFDAK